MTILLPPAAEQDFTIEDVAVNDVTLLEVLDLDQFLQEGGLNDPQVAGFILLHLDPKKIRLVAAGQGRGFTVARLKKEEFRCQIDTPNSDSPRKVVEVIPMPVVTIIRGSTCDCASNGACVEICK